MNMHGNRLEDVGIGRILKFWPLLVAIFTSGAWYQSATATKEMLAIVKKQTDEHELRITRVEDAVVYLKELVALRKREHRNE